LTHTSLALLRHKKAPAHTGIETKDLSGSQSMSGLESGFTTIQCAYRG
jgi:hypothetical protein